ncbi:MAG: four helix bundle protein [Anaerolineales bacterium]
MDAFPKKTQANVIAAQLFDAVTSIGANIAEGKAKYVGKEYLRYLSHAQGRPMKLITG